MIMRVIEYDGIHRRKVVKIGTVNGIEIYAKENKQTFSDMAYAKVYINGDYLHALDNINRAEEVLKKFNRDSLVAFIVDRFNKDMQSGKPVLLGLADILDVRELAQRNLDIVKEQNRQRYAEQDRQRELVRAEREKREALEFEARVKKAKLGYYNGEMIDNEMFIELCNRYKIDIPIKTKGWIIKSVGEIGKDSYSRDRNSNSSKVIGMLSKYLYNEIKEEIDPEEEEDDGTGLTAEEVSQLFGFGGYKRT